VTTSPPTAARTAYEEDGFFLVTEPIFPRDLVEGAIAGMDAVRNGEQDTGRQLPFPLSQSNGSEAALVKIEQPQLASKAVQELLSHPSLGRWALAITGASEVQVWWVQLLYKPSSEAEPAATNVGWHQDWSYWRPPQWEEGSELFTAWIALSDVDGESGPMRFVRGSHRWGSCDGSDFFSQDIDAQRQAIRAPEGAAWDEVSAVLPAGGVSFHHNLTFHGSGPNTSGRPRRSFAVHLRTENSRPVSHERGGLTAYIDDPVASPMWRASQHRSDADASRADG
jgi:hypothetical protein